MQSTQKRFLNAAHELFNWIPAFAGMTAWIRQMRLHHERHVIEQPL
jgi:hypothetical protein